MIVTEIRAQAIPQRWFGLTSAMRLDARFWTRVAEKLMRAGFLDFEATDDETVRRAIALVEGEDAGHRHAVMIQRVINGTPPGQKRPPPRKVQLEGRRETKHKGLGPEPVVLNPGICWPDKRA